MDVIKKKTNDIKLKFIRNQFIDDTFNFNHDLDIEQLQIIQKYTNGRSCGTILLKHRDISSLDQLYTLIVECLSYGKSITLDKMNCLYGIEYGQQRLDAVNKSKNITLNKMIELYGIDEGNIRWKQYCEKQALSNTFEYKKQKHGMTIEQFNDYNRSRSVTLENLINRHGVDKGTIMFNEYREKQRTVGITKDYFIEKYGMVDGTEKYKEVCIAKAKQCTRTSSQIAIEYFNRLVKDIPSDNVQCEYIMYSDQHSRVYVYDYVDFDRKFCVEFNGDFWHMNPSMYQPDDINKIKGKSAKEIWNEDELKRQSFTNQYPDFKYFTIWETQIDDYHQSLKESVI